MILSNLSRLTRVSALATHASLSLLIFFGLFFILIKFWYPAPYFSASGGWQGLKIVALVDIVLGPLLTFCVFNKTKPLRLLVMDLCIIFTLQIAALFWGIYTVYQEHPIAAVFWEDRFFTVPNKVLANQNYDLSNLQKISQQKPPLIYAEKPKSRKQLESILSDMTSKQIAPFQQPSLYGPIDQHLTTIFEHQINISEIIGQNPAMKKNLNELLKKLNRKLEQNYYIKLESRYRNIILIFSKTGQQLGYIEAPYKDKADI